MYKINLNLELIARQVESTHMDSTTSNAFKKEIKFFKCKPLRALQHVLGVSQNNYIKRHN